MAFCEMKLSAVTENLRGFSSGWWQSSDHLPCDRQIKRKQEGPMAAFSAQCGKEKIDWIGEALGAHGA
jgi:hypothetical protein